MSKFPNDIMANAERVYSKLGRGANQDVDAIAVALVAERVAERERCAKVASLYGVSDDACLHSNHAVACNAGSFIAAQIREASK